LFRPPEGREFARKSASAPLYRDAKLQHGFLGFGGGAQIPFPSAKILLELTKLSLFHSKRHDAPVLIEHVHCENFRLARGYETPKCQKPSEYSDSVLSVLSAAEAGRPRAARGKITTTSIKPYRAKMTAASQFLFR
jgi:hypothetical protein